MTATWYPFAIAAALVLALVPPLAGSARRIGLVDDPDRIRKLHETPIPLVGGIAVFAAMVLAVTSAVALGWVSVDATDVREMLGLLAASTLLVAVG
ncbi:MAG: undecaprenyl/decaprenyl-phosphate alpha-N-acetylglucosaminyl 1-phosphate transferase, partial [Alphaproteobacteria bacterium]